MIPNVRQILLWAFACWLAAVAPAMAAEPVTLQLKWLHQFQFAGYYAAVEKGFYAEAGLEVELREGDPGTDVEAELASGRAEFGVGNSNLLLSADAGRPFVVLGVILQHAPEILLTRRDPAIRTVADLDGLRLLDAPHSAAIAAMLAREGIDYAKLPRVPNDGDPRGLLNGAGDMMAAYSTNEPFVFEREGLPYSVFSPRSVGIDFYGDNLFTSRRLVDERPELVAAFREASLRGWRYAMQHPDEIADLILARYSSRKSRAHLLFEAAEMDRLMQPDLVEIGHMNPERWRRIGAVFQDLGLLRQPPPLDRFLYQSRHTPLPAWLPWIAGAVGLALLLLAALVVRLLALRRGLQESEGRFRALVEGAPVGIFRYGADLRIEHINRHFAELLGIEPERLLGLDMAQLKDRRILPAVGAVRRGEVGSYKGPYDTTVTGQTFEISMICAPVRSSDGSVAGGIGIVEDLTQLQRAEDERRTLLQAVEQSPVAVVVTDLEGRILFVNQRFEENTGYSRDEVVGQNPRLLQGGEKSPEEYQELWQTITAGGTWTGEFHNKRKDGTLYWERAVIAPVRDGNDHITHYLGVKEDITEKRQREEELQRLVATLTETNTELERFAYVASHDLREPLRTIASFAQLLERRYRGQLDADADEFIDHVVGAAKRMHRLIGDLTAYSRVASKGDRFTEVDVGHVCRTALQNLRESLEDSGAEVVLEPLPVLLGDEVQLTQLFQNLIGNAVKFRHPQQRPQVRVSACLGAEGWVLSVADNGIGIDERGQDVYEVFRRLHHHSAYPGTGVGLAICKKIVQRHGGTISHAPNAGGGTVFTVTLPAGLSLDGMQPASHSATA